MAHRMPRLHTAGSSYRAGRLLVWSGAATLSALLLVPTAGWSACVPNGAAIPNGASVTCSGADVTGVGNYTQNNVTVNVQQGASITLGINSGAINLNNNAVVTNNGAITGGFNSTGITVDNNSVLTNAGLLSEGDNGQGFEVQSGNTITNTSTGAITLGTGAYGINAIDNNKIVNNGAITGGAGTLGISLNQNNSVTNNGSITVGSTTVGPFGSWGIVVNHDGNTVINNGSITVGDAIKSSTSGIVDQWGGNTFTNTGVITVGGNYFGFTGGATGIVLNDKSTFTNTGTITVGEKANAIQFNGPGVTVNNSGRVIAGPNAWTLYGYNMFTGATAVSNSGTLDGKISLQNDSTLTNSGLITVTNAGTPLAQNFGIVGTFTQSASGSIALRATAAGQFDWFASRSANLGGTLALMLQPALYGDTTTYKGAFVTNTPLNGTFAQTVAYAPGTTIPLAFFAVTPTYNSTSVDLTLNRLGFGAVAGETSNERAVGNALNSIYATNLTGNAAAFFLNLLQSTSVKVLDPFVGEGTTGTQTTAFTAGSMFMTTLADQTNTWRNGDRTGIPAETRLGYAGEATSGPFARILKAPPPAYVPTWHGWASGFGGAQSLKGDPAAGSADFSDRFAGGVGGIDYEANPGLLIGAGAGASRSTFRVNDQATSGQVDGLHVGSYGIQRFGASYIGAVVGYSRFDNTTSRTIASFGPTEIATGAFSSDQFGGRLEVGHTFSLGAVGITPFAAAQASRLWQRGYAETSLAGGVPGQFGLTYAPVNVWSLPTFVGAQLDTRVTFANGMMWSPYVRAAWVHEFNTTRQVSAFITSLPASPFTVDGARAARDSAKVDVGSRLWLTANIAAIASFTGEFADRGQQTYAGTGTLRVNW